MDWKSRKATALIEAALLEDKALLDVTTSLTIDPAQRTSAVIVAREECVICGLGAVCAVFDVYRDLRAKGGGADQGRYEVISHREIFDGVRVRSGETVAAIRHNAGAVLACERVILNLMQRLSGIATLTNEFVRLTRGTHARVLDTRKTVPGLRLLDKYAVSVGGGINHRLDLADGILLKQSHQALAGGLAAAVKRAVEGRKPGQKVEVEVTSRDEADTAVQLGADVLLLVAMQPAEVQTVVERVRSASPAVLLEIADHLSLDNARAFAETGVDFLSVGALTRSSVAADLSMRLSAA